MHFDWTNGNAGQINFLSNWIIMTVNARYARNYRDSVGQPMNRLFGYRIISLVCISRIRFFPNLFPAQRPSAQCYFCIHSVRPPSPPTCVSLLKFFHVGNRRTSARNICLPLSPVFFRTEITYLRYLASRKEEQIMWLFELDSSHLLSLLGEMHEKLLNRRTWKW